MSSKQSLEHVKPGDILATARRGRYGLGRYDPPYEMAKVERVTAKQAALSDGRKVWLKNGVIVGNHWDYYFAPTSEQISEHNNLVKLKNEYGKLLDWFTGLGNPRYLSIEQLEAMKKGFDRVTNLEQQQ